MCRKRVMFRIGTQKNYSYGAYQIYGFLKQCPGIPFRNSCDGSSKPSDVRWLSMASIVPSLRVYGFPTLCAVETKSYMGKSVSLCNRLSSIRRSCVPRRHEIHAGLGNPFLLTPERYSNTFASGFSDGDAFAQRLVEVPQEPPIDYDRYLYIKNFLMILRQNQTLAQSVFSLR